MRKVALLLALAALPLIAQIPLPQAPTKYVTDAAGVLDDARELALNERLAQYERDTTNQIIVYVDRRMPAGTTIEEMGAEAIRTWKVGQAKKDNGAILFVFIDDRESRIEAGYGLEGSLTDAVSKRILVSMRPKLRDADYIGAAEDGVQAIFETIADPAAAQQQAEAETAVMQPVAEPVASSSSSPSGVFQDFLTWLFAVFFGLVVIIIIAVVRNKLGLRYDTSTTGDHSWGSSSSSDSSSWSSSSSSDYSSSSSSSSSSSDFSGGGGSGGGGGASDKW